MIRRILKQEDEFSVLRRPCTDVEAFDDALISLVADMWDSMYAANGVGLAATQIGSSLRVAVIDTPQRPNSNRRLVLVNPHIKAATGSQTGDEGCLSMPGQFWSITRAKVVSVSFQGIDGKRRELVSSGLLARAVQHECDHLDGILCNSRAGAHGEAGMTFQDALLKASALTFWTNRCISALHDVAANDSIDGNHHQEACQSLERLLLLAKENLLELNPLYSDRSIGVGVSGEGEPHGDLGSDF